MTLTLLALATDEAGNEASTIRSLTIWQRTDIPTLSFSNMTEGGEAKDNLFGIGNTTIFATATDDDGIAKIEYALGVKNTQTDEITYTYAALYTKGAQESAATTKSISLDLATLSPAITSGAHTIKFKVSDINASAKTYESPAAVQFGYDTESPQIELTSVAEKDYSSGMFTSDAFDVKGTATDDSQIASVQLYQNNAANGQNLFDSESGTWTDHVTGQTDTASGTYLSRTYIATDMFGRTATTKITYQVDTLSPQFTEYDNKSGDTAGKYHITVSGGTKNFTDSAESSWYLAKTADEKPVNWFNQTQLTITGAVEEAHLKSVTLTKGSATEGSEQKNKNFAFSEAFENGENSFTITALDEAEQSAALGPYTLYVDTRAPTVSAEAKQSDGTSAFESGTVLNASGVIKLSITAKDDPDGTEATSGIDAIYIGTSAITDKTSHIAAIPGAALTDSKTQSAFTIGDYPSLTDGTYTLYARALDVAGNYSEAAEITTFTVDNTRPSVTITTPGRGSTVNKKCVISGRVQDASLSSDAKPALYLKKKTGGDWQEASAASVPEEERTYTHASGEWSLAFNSELYDDETEYYIAVVFTDVAGNTTDWTTSEHTIRISQDSDRPTIIFANVAFSANMSAQNRVMITNEQINGSATDDDGISALYCQLGGTAADGWGENLYDETVGWSVSFATDGTQDGARDIYFKVVDAAGGIFISSTKDSYLTAPKIKNKSAEFSASTQDTIVYAQIDLIDPAITKYVYTTQDAQSIRLSDVTTYSYTLSGITDDDFAKLVDATGTTETATLSGWTDIAGISSTFGGTSNIAYILVRARDANGIDSISVKLDNALSPLKVLSKTDGGYGYKYALYKIDFSAYTNKKVLVISAKDISNRTATVSTDISIDNTAPRIEFKSPSENASLYGTSTNSIKGGSSDDTGVAHIYLGFSQNATDEPAAYTDILAKKGDATETSVTADPWTIIFDGSLNESDYSHLETFNTYIESVYGDGTTAAYTEKPLYIWAYGTDTIGNTGKSSPAKLPLTIMTQGDIPTLEVSYPGMNDTVGGTIRINGASTTADTSVTVEKILVQLDLSYEDSFSEDWESALFALINAHASKDTLLAEYPIEEYTLADGSTIRGIPASGTASWNLPINKYKEFNLKDNTGADKNRKMAVRAYAINSNESNRKASAPVLVPFELDPGSPVFGNSQPITLVQYADNQNGTGDITASQLYSDNMWIKGRWWLTCSIEDDSGIKQVTVSKDGAATTNIADAYLTDTTEPAGEANKNKLLCMPVGTDSENIFNTETYQIIAYEGASNNKSTELSVILNYDNKAPEFACTTLTSGADNTVAQSDYVYQMKGTVKEPSANKVNQSGFDRIAFWFTRTLDGKTYIVDPMMEQGSTGTDNRFELSASYTTGTEIVQDASDGLYWRRESGCTTNGKQITLSGSTLPKNVRAGGLCKVNNVIYRIAQIKDSNIFVSTELAASTDATVYFAVAQIIDNTTKESGRTTFAGDNSNSIDNDDGDEMVDYYVETSNEWVCSLNSKNIMDGVVTLHFFAFDKAGNKTTAEYSCIVSNNRPRIAGIKYGTDQNGNKQVDEDELKTSYSGLYAVNGLSKIGNIAENGCRENGSRVHTLALPNNGTDIEKINDSARAILTLKGESTFIPEIVGGNNALGYTCTVGNGTPTAYKRLNANHGGTNDVRPDSDTTIKLSMSELLSLTEDVGDTTTTFSFKLWDETTGTTAGVNSNYAELLLKLNIALRDSTPPTALIRPFYWEANADGKNSIAYDQNGALLGHIELTSDLPGDTFTQENGLYDADPKVSGTIYLEGQARDNVLVNKLYLSFQNLAKEATGTFGNGFALLAERTGSTWTPATTTLATQGVQISIDDIEDTTDEDEYNVVRFKLAINTELLSGVAGTDVEVRLQAQDRGTPSVSGGEITYTSKTSASSDTNTSGAAWSETNTPYCRVDVVPYVNGVSTALSSLKKNNPSVYNRTAAGHYAVQHDETVTFSGYNLGAQTTLSISELTESGAYDLIVNGVSALNNKNQNDAKGSYTYSGTIAKTGSKAAYDNYYNRQPNGDNNNLLTDDIVFDVWQITPKAVQPKNGYATQPVMAINPVTHDIGFAFVNGTLYFSMPNGKTRSYEHWIGGYDFWTSVGLTYDSLGNSYATAAGGDIADDRADQFRIMTSRWGQADLTVNGYDYGKNQFRLEYIAQADYYKDSSNKWQVDRNFNKERIKSPSLVTTTASDEKTTVYLAYYDDINDEIRFKHGSIEKTKKKNWYNDASTEEQIATFFGDYYGRTTKNTNDNITESDAYAKITNPSNEVSESWGKSTLEQRYGWYRIAHNSLIAGQTTEKPYKTYTYNQATNTIDASGINTISTAVTTTSGAPVHAGKYVSIGAIKDGGTNDDAVIAVWWDAHNNQLLYSYNLTPSAIAVGQFSQTDTKWTTPYAIFGAANGIGEYCKLVIDANAGVHIACYDGLNGDLWYGYIADFKNPSAAKTCIVDSYGIVGTELNIDVALDSSDKPVPYISYYAGSCARPKIAYWSGTKDITAATFDGGTIDDVFTGEWESSIVPTASKVSVDHINIGVWKDSDGKQNYSTTDGNAPAATNIGTNSFKAGTGSTTSYGTVWGNGTKNPVLGYAITQGSSGYIETAQMK